MHKWQFQKVKVHMSKLARLISVHGQEKVVMLSVKDDKKVSVKKPDFIEFMRQSPLRGVDLDMERDRSSGRNID